MFYFLRETTTYYGEEVGTMASLGLCPDCGAVVPAPPGEKVNIHTTANHDGICAGSGKATSVPVPVEAASR